MFASILYSSSKSVPIAVLKQSLNSVSLQFGGGGGEGGKC